MLFGKKTTKMKKMQVLNNLLLFLDLVQEKREQGIVDYIKEYEIEEIRTMLRCILDPITIDKVFAIYFSDNMDGIGYMAIESGNPIFTVR